MTTTALEVRRLADLTDDEAEAMRAWFDEWAGRNGRPGPNGRLVFSAAAVAGLLGRPTNTVYKKWVRPPGHGAGFCLSHLPPHTFDDADRIVWADIDEVMRWAEATGRAGWDGRSVVRTDLPPVQRPGHPVGAVRGG